MYAGLLACALSLTAPDMGLAGEPPGLRTQVDLPALVQRLLPAVVNITILKQRPMASGHMPTGGETMVGPITEVGSGFIIDPSGYVVTNRHVIQDAYRIMVTLAGGDSYAGHVVAINGAPDLALLKIDAAEPLPTVPFGNSEALEVGDAVVAIGNPLGLASSVSVGVVSALNRDVHTTLFDNFIQTDAAINHGNSGGPLFNTQGEVVGVNWALVQPEHEGGSIGLGLAIPSDTVNFVVSHMRQYGRLRPGWVGVGLQGVTQDIASAVGRTSLKGSIVTNVVPGGTAAGVLRPGDIVLAFDGRPTRDTRAVARAIASSTPGTTVPVRLWRDGQEQELPIKVANWPEGPGNPSGTWTMPDRGQRISAPSLGMTLAPLSAEFRERHKLPETQEGVAVLGVAANSPGADAGFTAGDVIVQIKDAPIDSMEDMHATVEQVLAARERSVLVLVRNEAGFRWLVVPTDAK
ncbi:trypsin-like peptidase domain-containing protein [Rhodovastum atsumiense]|uniref:trypsin-like peptidase domain-containing protein n=1 Tax=Rhodovastum atsumiense TaxID=504468 RepID=UPI0020251BE7|nr:trypsin-like peptidase domain-containing protein [Rhodovastum atsumiense]